MRRKQRGGALKEDIVSAVRLAPNFDGACEFLAGMESVALCASYPRGPYAGNKWVIAYIGEADGHAEEYGDYDKPHKIITVSMKIEGQNVSEVAFATYEALSPNLLPHASGHMPGGNEYIPAHGANPIANALEQAMDGICNPPAPAAGV